MSDKIDCPFCQAPCDCDFDPLGDGDETDIQCRNCDRTFVVTASVSVSYTASCRKGEHEWEPYLKLWPYEICVHCKQMSIPAPKAKASAP